ncbi:MAG: helix-turn-helix domain-containing protein, partial [Hyphomicrobiales bacterium]
YLGLTIETVSRHFTRLRAAGIIDLIDFRTIKVCDPDELARLSEPE